MFQKKRKTEDAGGVEIKKEPHDAEDEAAAAAAAGDAGAASAAGAGDDVVKVKSDAVKKEAKAEPADAKPHDLKTKEQKNVESELIRDLKLQLKSVPAPFSISFFRKFYSSSGLPSYNRF